MRTCICESQVFSRSCSIPLKVLAVLGLANKPCSQLKLTNSTGVSPGDEYHRLASRAPEAKVGLSEEAKPRELRA